MQVDHTISTGSLKEKIETARLAYLAQWRKIIREWNDDRCADRAWLTYSANYLLLSAGVRWALDPFSLYTRVGGGPQPDFAVDLVGLQLVVLSHAHNDHLDPNLLRSIQGLPITWVIPEFMLTQVLQFADLPQEHIVIPSAGQSIQVDGLSITPFDALHFRGAHGVPEMGYLAEFSGKRWLFPGDTRCYAADRLPAFGQLDGAFAHLWLGKGGALQDPPPLLDEFCHFFSALNPTRLVITHLYELGRDDFDLWDSCHADLTASALFQCNPDMHIVTACTGDALDF